MGLIGSSTSSTAKGTPNCFALLVFVFVFSRESHGFDMRLNLLIENWRKNCPGVGPILSRRVDCPLVHISALLSFCG